MASTAHHDERAPDRTTPQGTQAESVEHGHEGVDVDLPQVFAWFGGLLIFTIVVQILLWGTFKWWLARADMADKLPSPLFAIRQTPPPPRIEPNPVDYPVTPVSNPRAAQPDYPERPPGFHEKEKQEAQKLGLEDEKTGLPKLPEQAVAKVLATAHGPASSRTPGGQPAGPELEQPMPSYPSGGTRTEDRLR
jgi:hypothetical protein